MHMQGDIPFRFGTSKQRVKAVNFYVCKKLPKLIGYHSKVPWATAKLMSVIIPISISTNAEKVIEIGLVVAEIFGGICRFLPSRPKRYSCYPRNLLDYLTHLDNICTRCTYNIATKYFWIVTAIVVTVPERQPAEWTLLCQFYPENWLLWQRRLRNRKRGPV